MGELRYMFGGDECFARGSPVDTRWRVLLWRGTRLGDEYRQAWEDMQLKAI